MSNPLAESGGAVEYDFPIPPFEELYPFEDDWQNPEDDEDDDEPERPWITPRQAFQLWVALGLAKDGYKDDRDWLLEDLPLAARLIADDEWIKRFLACFDDIASRLESGGFACEQLAHCTGDEAALRLTLEMLADLVSDGEILAPPSRYPTYPGDDDLRWPVDIREHLVQDYDVDWLWEPKTAMGLPKALEQHMRPAHLEPEHWFIAFDNIVELPDEPRSNGSPRDK
jgi:hypothetical protein